MHREQIGQSDGIAPVVVVGICTCRSPAGLRKLLDALNSSQSDFLGRIVIVDNDRAGEGKALADSFAFAPHLHALAVVEENSGIPFARNRVIAEALKFPFDYLVMIDDDEYPAPGWLEGLVAAARQTGADVVSGAVEPVFEADVVPPALPSDFFKPGGMRIKGVDIVNSTANLLLTRRLLVDWQDNWFDNRMAHSGGSDTEFLWRVHRAGHKHAIASDARVYEDISAKRATPDWLLSRAFRNGSSLAVIRIKASGALIGGAREFVSASITVALSSLGMLLSAGDERKKFVSRMKYKRARGKISTLMGQIYQEYSSSNYR